MTGSELDGIGPRVLVTDFDGTMTRVDFFDVVLQTASPGSIPDYWGRCVAGELTHVAALDAIFRHGPRTLAGLEALLPLADLDPATPQAVRQLRNAGWDIVVISAGCDWYIRRILADVLEQVRLIANPGGFAPDTGLTMGWPERTAPWYSAHFGVDKRAVVQLLVERGSTVAFAGDGRPDLAAIRQVLPRGRFARGWLAETLAAEGLEFRRFDRWSEIATALTTARS